MKYVYVKNQNIGIIQVYFLSFYEKNQAKTQEIGLNQYLQSSLSFVSHDFIVGNRPIWDLILIYCIKDDELYKFVNVELGVHIFFILMLKGEVKWVCKIFSWVCASSVELKIEKVNNPKTFCKIILTQIKL